jgi:murein DD-endopeptidase MepM/ murein hydrolase activator NlpD
MRQARNAIEQFFASVSEILFVRTWQSGAAIWLALALFHPVATLVASGALAFSFLLHLVIQLTLTAETKRWIGLNVLLVGYGFVYLFGAPTTAVAIIELAGAVVLTHALAYAFPHLVPRQPALPMLTLPCALVIRLLAAVTPGTASHMDAPFASLELSVASVLPGSVAMFLRALGALFFVRDCIVGLVIFGIVLAYSRILASLAIASFIPAVILARLFLAEGQGEILAFNVMVTVMMVGAIWEIPSRWSYRHAFIAGGIAATLAIFAIPHWSPVLNIPFILATYAYILARPSLASAGALVFDFASGTPEQNLYYAQNRRERYIGLALPALALPFNGEWKVTQAHNGSFTHRNEWRHAWDFERVDGAGEVMHGAGTHLAEYHSYGQPVCAALEGEIANIQNYLPDNEPGTFNFRQSWGNTVVIRHPNGQCSAYSHLTQIPETVYIGRWLSKGELIGYCGNSGRSERPHIHFQLQALPNIGERTIDMPLRDYVVRQGDGLHLRICDKPVAGEIVSNVAYSARMAEVFSLPYGRQLAASGEINGVSVKETWVSTVDSLNRTYLFCSETGAAAYFFADRGIFHFTDYFGPTGSLLDEFSLAASRIVFSDQDGLRYTDRLPANRLNKRSAGGLADIFTPVVRISDIAASFRVGHGSDRTITITNSVISKNVIRGSRARTVADAEIVLPYGTQSIRLRGTRLGVAVAVTILY